MLYSDSSCPSNQWRFLLRLLAEEADSSSLALSAPCSAVRISTACRRTRALARLVLKHRNWHSPSGRLRCSC